MSEFKDPAYQDWLAHSAKGTAWKNHKYASKKFLNGKNIYEYDSSGKNSNQSDDYISKNAGEEGNDDISDIADEQSSDRKTVLEIQKLGEENGFDSPEYKKKVLSLAEGDQNSANTITKTFKKLKSVKEYNKSLTKKSFSSRNLAKVEHSEGGTKMSEFKDPAYQDWLAHSAKGTAWKNHKYISKSVVNGKMAYQYGDSGDDYSDSVDDDNGYRTEDLGGYKLIQEEGDVSIDIINSRLNAQNNSFLGKVSSFVDKLRDKVFGITEEERAQRAKKKVASVIRDGEKIHTKNNYRYEEDLDHPGQRTSMRKLGVRSFRIRTDNNTGLLYGTKNGHSSSIETVGQGENSNLVARSTGRKSDKR